MGKWDKAIASLPRYADPDESHQQRIDFVKKCILDASLDNELPEVSDIVYQYKAILTDVQRRLTYLTHGQRYASSYAFGVRDARLIKEQLDEHYKLVSDFIEAYTRLFIDQTEVEGSTSIKLGDGSSIRVQYEPYASVEDRDLFRQWCEEHGYLREFSMPWQTLNSMVKQHLELNEPEPPGVKVFNRPKIVFTKGR